MQCGVGRHVTCNLCVFSVGGRPKRVCGTLRARGTKPTARDYSATPTTSGRQTPDPTSRPCRIVSSDGSIALHGHDGATMAAIVIPIAFDIVGNSAEECFASCHVMIGYRDGTLHTPPPAAGREDGKWALRVEPVD